MSKITESQRSGGIGFFGLLTILFIGLKLTNYIHWSWLWVLAPMWLPVGLVLGLLLIAIVLAGIAAVFGR